MNPKYQLRPSAINCFGREKLASEIISAALQSQTVLLFGGRQSGKTTLLQFIESLTIGKAKARVEFDENIIGVYIDLLRLEVDAGPPEFYVQLLKGAHEACHRHFCDLSSFDSQKLKEDTLNIESFLDKIKALRSAAGPGHHRFIFLLDESKRVLGSRFPRGFQDNLFSVLYGGSAEEGRALSFVFAGAQELYSLSEDETSPLGSRAAVQLIRNLNQADLVQLVEFASGDLAASQSGAIASATFRQSGGHAGVSARFVEVALDQRESLEPLAHELPSQLSSRLVQLFRQWNGHLTSEARRALTLMQKRARISRRELANFLEDKNLDRLAADRVWDELQFVGIARLEGGHLEKSNLVYWNYLDEIAFDSQEKYDDPELWRLIEATEVALRSFIKSIFLTKWCDPYAQMKKILKADWEKLERIKVKSEAYYQYAREKANRDIMECMYLGQMTDLILANECWELFKGMFRDKRHLQDIMAAISPVRNDRAHFCDVPKKEMDRCKIACDDLLVIIERNSG